MPESIRTAQSNMTLQVPTARGITDPDELAAAIKRYKALRTKRNIEAVGGTIGALSDTQRGMSVAEAVAQHGPKVYGSDRLARAQMASDLLQNARDNARELAKVAQEMAKARQEQDYEKWKARREDMKGILEKLIGTYGSAYQTAITASNQAAANKYQALATLYGGMLENNAKLSSATLAGTDKEPVATAIASNWTMLANGSLKDAIQNPGFWDDFEQRTAGWDAQEKALALKQISAQTGVPFYQWASDPATRQQMEAEYGIPAEVSMAVTGPAGSVASTVSTAATQLAQQEANITNRQEVEKARLDALNAESGFGSGMAAFDKAFSKLFAFTLRAAAGEDFDPAVMEQLLAEFQGTTQGVDPAVLAGDRSASGEVATGSKGPGEAPAEGETPPEDDSPEGVLAATPGGISDDTVMQMLSEQDPSTLPEAVAMLRQNIMSSPAFQEWAKRTGVADPATGMFDADTAFRGLMKEMRRQNKTIKQRTKDRVKNRLDSTPVEDMLKQQEAARREALSKALLANPSAAASVAQGAESPVNVQTEEEKRRKREEDEVNAAVKFKDEQPPGMTVG